MKIGKISGFFNVSRNPYNRWGVSNNVSIGEKESVKKEKMYSYIKITMKDGATYFFGGYNDKGKIILVEKLAKAVEASKKTASNLRKKYANYFLHINIVRFTKKMN